MAIISRYFPTKQEAKAFVEGVEYVNDSSIESIEIKPRKTWGDTGFDVLIDDRDRTE